jgi:hypothetical protein
MKITQLKPKDIVIYKQKVCSVLAVVRAPFIYETWEPKLASFVKLAPIIPFEPDRFVRVQSDAQFQWKPYVRDIKNKFCTVLSFDDGSEPADISTLDITLP